jgi:nitric oxide reductase subunit B
MPIPSFLPSKDRDTLSNRSCTGRNNRIDARITELVASGKTTVERLATRARSGSKHAIERKLDEYDLRLDDVNERMLEELLNQCEVTVEQNRPESSQSKLCSAFAEVLGRYDPNEDHLLELIHEIVSEHPDIDLDAAGNHHFESVLDRYGLNDAYLGERTLNRIRNREGSDSDLSHHPFGPTLAVLMPILAQYEANNDDSRGTASLFLNALKTALNQYEPDSDDCRETASIVSTAIKRTLDHYESDDTDQNSGSRALGALFIANLVAMGLGAWVSRRNAPPIPEQIEDSDGEPLVTGEQIRAGKKAFQATGLMNQGSILGNGAYFGTDLTADALELKARWMRHYYARERGASSFENLDDDGQVAVRARVKTELDEASGPTAQYSPAEVDAHRHIRQQYVDRYYEGDADRGIPSRFVDTKVQARRIADFALWTAWIAHADRPGANHSYTNDWPYVPGAGNRPTSQSLLWSSVSVILLVAGGGIAVWAHQALDLAEPATEKIDVPTPDNLSITPSQRATARYVPVAGILFSVQTLLGALLAHYHVERTGFFGFFEAVDVDIVSLIPFTAARTWHLNLAILWITTLWLAGGLFLPGLLTDHEPRFQAQAITALLGALVVATVGAFVGVWLGIQGVFDPLSESDLWWWLGNEGLEYLEVGRLWKLLLLVGFVGWTGLVVRGVAPLLQRESRSGIGHLLVYAGGSIALLFGASMLYTPETNLAVTEFWRWWVVHMWVEGVFEFFMVAVVSIALVSMNLLEEVDAERAIRFEVFAIMGAGVVGVSHHYWWIGLPDLWVPIGTVFSTLEFIPIVFVLYRALGEYRSFAAQGREFPYSVPFLFIVGATVWNFVGAGVLGFFLNLPVLNYYEHGTFLTLAHSHAATFGAFGLLALGLGVYILRVVTPEAVWDPTWFRRSFWLANAGLAIMVFASLLPVGFLQLKTVYEEGFAAGRDVEFYNRPLVQKLSWARFPGDTLIIMSAITFTVASLRHLFAEGDSVRSHPNPT